MSFDIILMMSAFGIILVLSQLAKELRLVRDTISEGNNTKLELKDSLDEIKESLYKISTILKDDFDWKQDEMGMDWPQEGAKDILSKLFEIESKI